MKQLSKSVPLLLCLAACQSDPTTPDAAAANPAAAGAKPANAEHVEVGALTVNGKPNAELSTEELGRQLGRPDSIAKGAVECGGALQALNKPDHAAGDLWYYGNTMYEVSGSQAILHSFDVSTGKFQGQLGELVLNQNTTLEDVRRHFPVSAKQADAPSSRQREEMTLPVFHNGVQMDNSIILQFNKGRLQEVEFFSPC